MAVTQWTKWLEILHVRIFWEVQLIFVQVKVTWSLKRPNLFWPPYVICLCRGHVTLNLISVWKDSNLVYLGLSWVTAKNLDFAVPFLFHIFKSNSQVSVKPDTVQKIQNIKIKKNKYNEISQSTFYVYLLKPTLVFSSFSDYLQI